MATQKLASLVHYDPLIGEPFMYSNGEPYYYPWKIIVWYFQFHEYLPNLFGQTFIYIYFGFAISLAVLYFVQPQRRLTSHGSAHWAEYKDLLKMDLISSKGVIIGLYDSNLRKC